MEVDCIPYRKTGYFSPLICDYLDQHPKLKPFYHRFPTLENFKDQLEEKSNNFSDSQRGLLVEQLQHQYEGLTISQLTSENIDSLSKNSTFTIITGHQLNLFTGPLYFLYKIISTINLCETLRKAYPKNDFVPVYWMASEDHDFDEINYFNFQGAKIQWSRPEGGAVGQMDTDGLADVGDIFSTRLGASDNAKKIYELFTSAYNDLPNLSDATRYLANALFGEYGLVVIDGDDAGLKKSFIPYIKKDVFEQLPFQNVSASAERLSLISKEYRIQVNPREINYFYLKKGIRERIVRRGDDFTVNNTEINFTKAQLEKELENHPERFSPNVIARPLYQEAILPNLCYIGGGGELAYWLELKDYFQAMGITFPLLFLRNSALVMTQKQAGKVERLDISLEDIFLKQEELIQKKIKKISDITIDFSPQKKLLEDQFVQLYDLAEKTDQSFLGAVKAQETKQKNCLDTLEKRLLKAQKRKFDDHVVRLTALQNLLFPNSSLQERQLNFSELYLEYGEDLIPRLKKVLQPLKLSFSILRN
ncbi:MAG: bacillithiol biosynthesis cysteine-adding enzyme BshC [Croceivirga sp.]